MECGLSICFNNKKADWIVINCGKVFKGQGFPQLYLNDIEAHDYPGLALITRLIHFRTINQLIISSGSDLGLSTITTQTLILLSSYNYQ